MCLYNELNKHWFWSKVLFTICTYNGMYTLLYTHYTSTSYITK